jgi:hypothetical protein
MSAKTKFVLSRAGFFLFISLMGGGILGGMVAAYLSQVKGYDQMPDRYFYAMPITAGIIAFTLIIIVLPFQLGSWEIRHRHNQGEAS